MAGHRKWADIRQARGPEAEARIERYKQEMRAAMSLNDLRQARRMTQTQLANALNVQQPAISRIERQADLYLSTLRSYIEAMGGALRIEAVFPDATLVVTSLGSLAAPDEAADDGDLPSDAVHGQYISRTPEGEHRGERVQDTPARPRQNARQPR